LTLFITATSTEGADVIDEGTSTRCHCRCWRCGAEPHTVSSSNLAAQWIHLYFLCCFFIYVLVFSVAVEVSAMATAIALAVIFSLLLPLPHMIWDFKILVLSSVEILTIGANKCLTVWILKFSDAVYL